MSKINTVLNTLCVIMFAACMVLAIIDKNLTAFLGWLCAELWLVCYLDLKRKVERVFQRNAKINGLIIRLYYSKDTKDGVQEEDEK